MEELDAMFAAQSASEAGTSRLSRSPSVEWLGDVGAIPLPPTPPHRVLHLPRDVDLASDKEDHPMPTAIRGNLDRRKLKEVSLLKSWDSINRRNFLKMLSSSFLIPPLF